MKNPSLSSLAVLAIDCQAAYSLPSDHQLLEVGWKRVHVSLPIKPEDTSREAEVYLVKKPAKTRIPRKILSITGIKREELYKGTSKKTIWNRLCCAARRLAVENQGISPALIHYKRYEEPCLRQLHHECAPRQMWPFTSILCTHEIFRALHPGHPRKSLRAVAGFLGFPLPRNRRSLDHVAATAFIWCHMVHELEEREGITRLEELMDWLRNSQALSSFPKCCRDYPMKKKILQSLPDRPGVYRMYRSTGDLLYIGKAKSLKKMVNSYFYQNSRHAEHILEMLSQAQVLTISETQSALEAAVKESEEIKRLAPPYNRALRPEGRAIVFYSKDLRRKKPEPDCLHPVGPVLSSIQLDVLPKLTDILNGLARTISPRYVETMLNIPEGYGPDLDSFKAGLKAFMEESVFPIEPPVTLVLPPERICLNLDKYRPRDRQKQYDRY